MLLALPLPLVRPLSRSTITPSSNTLRQLITLRVACTCVHAHPTTAGESTGVSSRGVAQVDEPQTKNTAAEDDGLDRTRTGTTASGPSAHRSAAGSAAVGEQDAAAIEYRGSVRSHSDPVCLRFPSPAASVVGFGPSASVPGPPRSRFKAGARSRLPPMVAVLKVWAPDEASAACLNEGSELRLHRWFSACCGGKM